MVNHGSLWTTMVVHGFWSAFVKRHHGFDHSHFHPRNVTSQCNTNKRSKPCELNLRREDVLTACSWYGPPTSTQLPQMNIEAIRCHNNMASPPNVLCGQAFRELAEQSSAVLVTLGTSSWLDWSVFNRNVMWCHQPVLNLNQEEALCDGGVPHWFSSGSI